MPSGRNELDLYCKNSPCKRSEATANLIQRHPGFIKLDQRLSGRLSKPGDDRYTAATAIWAKPVGRMPRVVAHCRTAQDVQSAIRAARDGDLPLWVRGGGHDWAGRELCEVIVIDLTVMNDVNVDPGPSRRMHLGRCSRFGRTRGDGSARPCGFGDGRL